MFRLMMEPKDFCNSLNLLYKHYIYNENIAFNSI